MGVGGDAKSPEFSANPCEVRSLRESIGKGFFTVKWRLMSAYIKASCC